MKKLILSILFIFISTFSYAENFYVRSNSTWNVIGKQNDDELNPACFAITSWKDGSEFRLIFDLADGERYMLFINNQWNISDQPGKYNFRLNMYINNDVIGDNAVYELLNKNTLRVRGLPIKFVDVFAQSNRMQFIMPGNINNATVNLKGSSQAIDFMSECIKKYKPSNQQPKSKNFGISL